jgi:hypothetical protein
VRHAKETNFEHLLIDDGLWFYYKYPPPMIRLGVHQEPLF